MQERTMSTEIAVQMTSQGLLVPRAALGDWDTTEWEAVREKQAIVIRPKLTRSGTRAQVRQVLREAGMLYEPDWEPTSPPISDAELAELAQKFSIGQPLSEIIIEERDEKW
jgi:hypothetical protein